MAEILKHRIGPLARMTRRFALGFVFCALVFSKHMISQEPGLVWKPQQAPAIPGSGALMNGGSAAPAFLCRARDGAGVYPGQWISGGNCAIAHDGRTAVKPDYEVAYGHATWADYHSGTAGLTQTGSDAAGSPLFSCRVQYRGYQVGAIIGNMCAFAVDGRYIAQRPPFEALYSEGSAPPSAQANSGVSPAQSSGSKPSGNQRRNQDDLSALAPGANGNNPGDPANSCRQEVGKAQANLMVKQCLQVSPATHPPCNAENNCQLIRSEIRRGCGLLGTRAPGFCEDYR